MYISTWFRGKAVTLADLLTMDIGYVSTLNRMAYEESRSKSKRDAKGAQELEDAMYDEGL